MLVLFNLKSLYSIRYIEEIIATLPFEKHDLTTTRLSAMVKL